MGAGCQIPSTKIPDAAGASYTSGAPVWSCSESERQDHFFSSEADGRVTIQTIPFPSPTWIQTQVLVTGAGKALRTIGKKWHPDSFWNKFGSRIEPADKTLIMGKVTETFQTLSGLASKYRR